MNDPSAPLPTSARRRRGLRIMHLAWGIAVLSLVLAGVVAVREAGREKQCQRCVNNLKQIGLALQEYHDAYGAFPPSYIADSTGKPMHSWRMLIIPYIEHTTWYTRYNWSEPWNGPTNGPLLASIHPSVYCCPLHPDHLAKDRTSYLAVVGKGAAFPPGGRSARMGDFLTGSVLPPIISVVESQDSDIAWMEPRDLDIDAPPGTPVPHISSPHPGPCLMRMDGSVDRAWTGYPAAPWAPPYDPGRRLRPLLQTVWDLRHQWTQPSRIDPDPVLAPGVTTFCKPAPLSQGVPDGRTVTAVLRSQSPFPGRSPTSPALWAPSRASGRGLAGCGDFVAMGGGWR